MKAEFNELWPEDEEFFAKMKDQYISDEEKFFFEEIRNRQENDMVMSMDCLVSGHDNPDHIYIGRVMYEEYIVGRFPKDKIGHEIHVMNMSEAMAINIKDLGCDQSLTLLEWLRSNNYHYINYNNNLDNL